MATEVIPIPHDQIPNLTLRHSSRAKRISIQVCRSGEVRIVLPHGAALSTAIDFVNRNITKIIATQQRIAKSAPTPKAQLSPKEKAEKERNLRNMARQYLPQRVERIAQQLGMKYSAIRFSSARTRWASCSSRNSLSLSIYMMELPEHLRDFIIVHELCHTIHKNHSRQFHTLVDRCVNGREKEFIAELKRFSPAAAN